MVEYISCITVFIMLGIGFPVVFCVLTKTNLYQRTNGHFLQETFSTITAASKVTCCEYCDQSSDCKSVNFQKTSKICQLSRDPLVAVGVNAQLDQNWSIYSKDEWMLVFRATQGIGNDVYTAWTKSDSVTTDDVTCMTTDVTLCSKHYRNPIVDSWTSIGMLQVKFALYKNNVEVAYVKFDATGSNITDWFSNTRIVQSSWTTISSDSFNYFSIIGHLPSRRFLINRTHGGCQYDTGYAVVIVSEAYPCVYDVHTSYPQFIYTNSTTYGSFGTLTAVHPEPVHQIQYGGQSIVQNPTATNLWMARPEGTVGCPSGLEYLSIIDGLMFKQFMDIAPGGRGRQIVNNSWFKVENFMGQQIYFVTEETDMGGVCLPGQRGYTIHISDNVGSEVMRISRQPICCSCCPCCGCCGHLIQIEAPVGHTLGYIKSRKNCMSPLFAITNAEDEDIFSISFPLCSTSSPMHQQVFTIKSADGQSDVATITKPWGRIELYYRLKDFSLRFPVDLDVKMKALLLASVFVIDTMYYPPHQMLTRRRGRRM